MRADVTAGSTITRLLFLLMMTRSFSPTICSAIRGEILGFEPTSSKAKDNDGGDKCCKGALWVNKHRRCCTGIDDDNVTNDGACD
jgi:hypothetical protein